MVQNAINPQFQLLCHCSLAIAVFRMKPLQITPGWDTDQPALHFVVPHKLPPVLRINTLLHPLVVWYYKTQKIKHSTLNLFPALVQKFIFFVFSPLFFLNLVHKLFSPSHVTTAPNYHTLLYLHGKLNWILHVVNCKNPRFLVIHT